MTDNEIENILRSYPRLKAKSDIEREKLYNAFPSCVGCGNDGQPHASGISNQTANYGIENAINADYLLSKVTLISQQVRVLELIYGALTSDCRDLVKYYYWEKLKRYEVQAKLNLSDGQFKVRRREVLDAVADILKTTSKQPQNDLIIA